MRWWAPAVALAFLALGCGRATAPRASGNTAHFAVGSDLWFAALFRLSDPVDGGPLHFGNDHLAFIRNSIDFVIPIRLAALEFSPGPGGENQWRSRLPLSFNELEFSANSWDAAGRRSGGITLTREAGLLVTVGTPLRRRARGAP